MDINDTNCNEENRDDETGSDGPQPLNLEIKTRQPTPKQTQVENTRKD